MMQKLWIQYSEGADDPQGQYYFDTDAGCRDTKLMFAFEGKITLHRVPPSSWGLSQNHCGGHGSKGNEKRLKHFPSRVKEKDAGKYSILVRPSYVIKCIKLLEDAGKGSSQLPAA